MNTMKYTVALATLLLTLATGAIGGCGVYKINIQQGNFLDDERIAELKVGMTKRQVEFLLGSPAVHDSFHPDRWDYVFYFRNGKTDGELHRNLVVYFEGDKVSEIVLPEDLEDPA